ncbi:MAG TPA: hypothetical protein VF462_15345, partial [Micromonosporaceae bacterium]
MFSAHFARSAHPRSTLRHAHRWGRSGGLVTSVVLLAMAVGATPAADRLPVRQAPPRPAAGETVASAPPVRVQ